MSVSARTLTEREREQRRVALRARWGPPRVINLHDLAPEQRAFIAELVEVARRNAPKVAPPGEEAP